MQDNPLVKYFIDPGLSLLPSKMDTPEARAMLLAIGFQESAFKYRLQIGGPARGFWQFEKGGGVAGVLNHPSTKSTILAICEELRIESTPESCYQAIAYNDALACAFARLLLWTVPAPLPAITEPIVAWNYYLTAWRPGKPHQDTWGSLHARAVEIVTTKGDLT